VSHGCGSVDNSIIQKNDRFGCGAAGAQNSACRPILNSMLASEPLKIEILLGDPMRGNVSDLI
jgi:hypothetical protein